MSFGGMTVRRIRKLLAWVAALVVLGLIVLGIAAVVIYATGGHAADAALRAAGVVA